MNTKIVGQKIKYHRLQLGLTQSKLAERLNVTNKAVSSWECGNSIPDVMLLPELCEILGISIDMLLSDSFEETYQSANTDKDADLTGGNESDNIDNEAVKDSSASNEEKPQKKSLSKRKFIFLSAILTAVIAVAILLPILLIANSDKTVTLVSFGEEIGEVKVGKNGLISEPEVNKDGYVLLGWYSNAAYTNEWKFEADRVDKNTKLYIKWQTVVYDINYNLYGGTASDNPDTYTVESKDIAFNAPVRTASVFLGWSVSSLLTDINPDFTLKSGTTGNITLYAAYTTDISIVFKSADELLATVDYNGQPISFIYPEEPKRENYTFNGWFWDEGEWNQEFTLNSIFDRQIDDKRTLTVYAKWSIIDKYQVEKPTLCETNFTFDGTVKTAALSLPDDSVYVLSGDVTKTNAGNYYATVALKNPDEYEWTDGTSGSFSLQWSISKIKVEKPVLTATSFVYDGTVKTVVLSLQNDAVYALNGDVTKTNAGNYTAEVVLINTTNYEWADSTINKLSLSWSVEKAASSPEIPLNITAGFGQTLSLVDLPAGWAWVNQSSLVGDTGQRNHNAVYTPEDTQNYTSATCSIPVQVTHSVSNIRVDSLTLRWDSGASLHKISFEIDGVFVYCELPKTHPNRFDILDIPENATAIGIEQLNAQWALQERAIIHLTEAQSNNVSIYSVGSSDILTWNSSVSSHRIYFLDGEEWVFYDQLGTSILLLDIPTYVSKMRILPIDWSYDAASESLIAPIAYDIPIATVTHSTVIGVTNLQLSGERLSWNVNYFFSNFRIDLLIDGKWQFDQMVTYNGYTGNSISLYSYVDQNVEAISITPAGWNSTLYNSVNNSTETFHIVRITPTVVSVSFSSEQMVTNLKLSGNYLQRDSAAMVHSFYAKVDGDWRNVGTSSSGTTGISMSLGIGLLNYEAYRILPETMVYRFDQDTASVQIISPLPTDIIIEESQEAASVISNIKIENSELKWTRSHGGAVTLYFKIADEWIRYGYNGSGCLSLNDIPESATAVRIVPIDGIGYSFGYEPYTLALHLEMQTAEKSFEESSAPFEVFTNLRLQNSDIQWDSTQSGPRSIYFKVADEWVLYTGTQWRNSISLSSIPEGATAVKIVLNKNIAFTYDEDTDTIFYHTNISPLEHSLPIE